MKKEIIGEVLGTLILVAIGCGSVAVAVLYNNLSLWQVASIWGSGVALAIYATSSYSKAHLNPAVSFGFYLQKKISLKELTIYSFAQLIGGIMGGLLVFLFFQNDIIDFEASNSIIRNGENGRVTSQMFGEFFPNPGFEDSVSIGQLGAFCYELIGTFLLFVIIQIAIKPIFSSRNVSPLVIGFGLALLIIWIAPYTQAGFNPARDFGPRIIAYIKGWENSSFPQPWYALITVYILAPTLGAGLAAIATRKWND